MVAVKSSNKRPRNIEVSDFNWIFYIFSTTCKNIIIYRQIRKNLFLNRFSREFSQFSRKRTVNEFITIYLVFSKISFYVTKWPF